MALPIAFDVVFGSKDSFCFIYANQLTAMSSNLPLNVNALFEKDRTPPVTKISCLAFGPDGRCAVVYSSEEQRYMKEHNPHTKATCADVI